MINDHHDRRDGGDTAVRLRVEQEEEMKGSDNSEGTN